MSIKAMSAVWENSEQKGSALLLLLAIADHAHDDGTGAFPSVASLAKKTRMQERQTRTLIQLLAKTGELLVERNAGPSGVNRYAVRLAGVQRLHLPFGMQDPPAPERTTPLHPSAPVTVTEPSSESSFPPGGAAAPDESKDQVDASAVVAAYARGRKEQGHPPCDPRGRSILGQHAKAYLGGPKDPRIIGASWYDPAAERTRRLDVAIRAATRAGEQGRNPGFLSDWLIEQQNVVARQHHSEHGRGRVGGRNGDLRPLRVPQAVAG